MKYIFSAQYQIPLALLLFLQPCSQYLAADPVHEQEPNNSIATAQPVSPIASIGGEIDTASDTDYFAFRAEPGDSIQADILAQGFRAGSQPGSELSARLSLIDTDGVTVLIEAIPAGSYDDPFVEYIFSTSGTYFLKVADQNDTGGTGHTYVLSVEREYPDNIQDKASWITPPVLPSIDALIHPPGDIDEYKFNGKANQVVTIDIDSAIFNPTNPAAETVVVLMDNSGNTLIQDQYDPVIDPADPYIQYTLPADDVYRITINERRSYVGTTNTFYQLSVDLGPAISNNTFGTASPVTLPRSTSGTLAPAGDSDFYQFAATTAGSIRADLDAREDLSSLITSSTLTLHDTSGAITLNSSSPDPELNFPINPGLYAIAVSGGSSDLPEDAYYLLYMDSDTDSDNMVLPFDNCPTISNNLQTDSDNDGIGDACDSCPSVFGPDQSDNDNDGQGDACDLDDDDDGLDDDFEHAIGSDPFDTDTDDDGLSDYDEVAYDGDPDTFIFFIDLNPLWWDSDFDGVSDLTDTAPLNYNFNDGDLAPLGSPDGIIDAADLLIATRIALGKLTPTDLELSHGDIYPAGSPDGVINIQDIMLLLNLL